MQSTIETGAISTPHGKVAYRRVHPGEGIPLLVVHGGPGAGSRYLRQLTKLAPQRDIFFYDQLGCGDSDVPDDPELWVIERFAHEIQLVREHLGLEDVHLFAHSSGGWFAIEYLIHDPEGVRSVTLANTTASLDQFSEGVSHRIAELPSEDREIIELFGSDPWSLDGKYRESLCRFYVRHIVATTEQAVKLLDMQRNSAVYTTMLGPHELAVTGTLRGWDRRAELAAVRTPALIVAGGHDHILPTAAMDMGRRLPDSELTVLEHCGHDPLNESTDEMLGVLEQFLARRD